MDTIFINKLCVRVILSSEAVPRIQPLLISVYTPRNIFPAAISDEIDLTINYATLADSIARHCDEKKFKTLLEVGQAVLDTCPSWDHFVSSDKVIVEQPRGFFRAASMGLELSRVPTGTTTFRMDLMHFIKNLQLSVIVGINPEERIEKQFVQVDLRFGQPENYDCLSLPEIATDVAGTAETSMFLTVEALAWAITQELRYLPKLTVSVIKPKALMFAEGAGVRVVGANRKEKMRSGLGSSLVDSHGVLRPNLAYIAFGSNIEPRIDFITKAMNLMKDSPHTSILSTSFLYESFPMHFLEQAMFYNGVAKICTSLDPYQLMEWLQNIENDIGKKKEFQNGPRQIDLDILFFNDSIINTPAMKIPHPRLQQREFVLKPLLDVVDEEFTHPILQVTSRVLLQRIKDSEIGNGIQSPTGIKRVLPFPKLETGWEWKRKTLVMGILNTSLDSFSEPGIPDCDMGVKAALKMEVEGADVIDIGAVSRRPGSTENLSTEDEIQALVSLIRLARVRGLKIPISVDVFKSEVAEAAIRAGGNIVNDVGMGVRDPEMIQVVSELGVPIIFMHTRGDCRTMLGNTVYKCDDVVQEVIHELHQVVQKALEAGVFRWNIIIDPGIGFAKNGEQNMEILRNLSKFNEEGSLLANYPILSGASRKKFIGTLTGVKEPSKRLIGSLAAVAGSISTGADMVRVHDVPETIELIKFSDAFWRNSSESN